MPQGKNKKFLKNKIDYLSKNFGGPSFSPHVTLIGSFLGEQKDLIEKTKQISEKIKAFEIYFYKLCSLDKFFQSLFLDVKLNRELVNARNYASHKLGCSNDNYEPHLSLAYGEYSKKVKDKMISTIDKFPQRFFVDKIFLAHNNEINLRWKIIKDFPLIK